MTKSASTLLRPASWRGYGRASNRALTQSEITELYRIGAARLKTNVSIQKAGPQGGLVGNWTFNGQDMDWASTTAEALDRSGYNNNGDVTVGGLVGYWKLDENPAIDTTPIADSSTEGNNGTLTTNDGSTNKSVGGKVGQAINFDGTDDYVNISTAYSLGTQASYSFWINPSGTGWRSVLGINNDVGVQINTDGEIYVGDAGAHPAFYSVGTVANGQWSHVVVTIDGTSAKIYINGNLDNSGTQYIFNLKLIGVDHEPSADEFFNGLIDEVRVYDRALSQAEITELYNGSGGPTPVPGISGQALKFDGVDDHVNVGHPASLNNIQVKTITAWIKLDTFGGGNGGRIIEKEHGSAEGGWVFSLWGGDVTTYANKNSIRYLHHWTNNWTTWSSPTNSITIGPWYHVALIFDNSSNINDPIFYINGSLVATTEKVVPSGTTLTDSTIDAMIGFRNVGGGDATFDGIIDEFRIYSRALSASEITELYRIGAARLTVNTPITKAGAQGGLVGNWTFNGPDMDWASSTAEALDRSGQNNNGDVTVGGLVGYWKLDENPAEDTTGIVDFSGQRNNGILTTNDGAANKSAPGHLGQALNFDGTDDYVDVGNPTSLQITGSVSISAWVNLRDYNAVANRVATKAASGAASYELVIDDDPNNNLMFLVSSNGTLYAYRYQNSQFPTNQWIHITGVYNSSAQTITLYRNGSLVTDTTLAGTESVPASINNSVTNVRIGRRGDDLHPFNGLIDDVRIYNRALSQAEITELYNGKGGPTPVPGISGQALNFDGVDDYVDVDNLLFPSAYPFTYAAWFKTSSIDASMTILSIEDVNDDLKRTQLYFTLVGNIGWNVRNGAAEAEILAGSGYNDSKWHHAVGVSSASNNHKLYVDGVLINTDTTDVTLPVFTQAAIGRWYRMGANDYFWNGLIDEVRVYNRALSAQEILDLYRVGAARVKIRQ